MGRKIPFENVIRNIKLNRYNKIAAADYSNLGVWLFDAQKFADNLGVNLDKLKQDGIIKKTEQAGWHLYTQPTVNELLEYKNKMAEIK